MQTEKTSSLSASAWAIAEILRKVSGKFVAYFFIFAALYLSGCAYDNQSQIQSYNEPFYPSPSYQAAFQPEYEYEQQISAVDYQEVLQPEHTERVLTAEYQANLRTCLQGDFPIACNHKILLPEHKQQVLAAEYQANLRNCQSGYSYLCNRALLNNNDAAKLSSTASLENPSQGLAPARETHQNDPRFLAKSPVPRTLPTQVGGCAENGSCYGDISNITGLAKTVPVSGYFRRDGTYVRGHYRSHR